MSRVKFAALRALILSVALLAGCMTVGPDYIPPDVSVPAKWSTEPEGGATVEPADTQALATWWATLNDPTLTSLLERAIEGNLDMREAEARVRESRARRDIGKAVLFPNINTSGSANHSRSSEQTGVGTERDLYAVGFDAGWEVDLFGGVRRSIESAEADLEASEEGLHNVLVSLTAEVALNYAEMRTLQTRLSIAEKNLNTQDETYRLASARFEAGLTSRLDVEQAKYNLESTRAQIPPLQARLDQALNRLAVLLGENPGSLDDELSGRGPVPITPLEIAVGVPADVLRQRPDVRRAERLLAAQTAQVGVATAELYPKFKLTGSIGLEALSSRDLLSSGSRTYGFGPSFTWPVFNAGSIRKNIEVQSALQEQALIRYEAAILTALEEVENALVAYADEQVRRESLLEASQAAQRAVDLAESQYSSGLINFQIVLDAHRSLLSLQDQLSISEGEVTSDLIRLCKALGGGWTSLTSAEKRLGG